MKELYSCILHFLKFRHSSEPFYAYWNNIIQSSRDDYLDILNVLALVQIMAWRLVGAKPVYHVFVIRDRLLVYN